MLLALREINFLDAFKEVAYLLEDFATELVFYCSSGHASSFAAFTTATKFAFKLMK
jgi:rhodanese-related sulfurtransferase